MVEGRRSLPRPRTRGGNQGLMATKTYTAKTREQEAAIRREAMDLVTADRQAYGERVQRRLERAPRFQSIGRKQYVYVEDVAAALEAELNTDMVGGEE